MSEVVHPSPLDMPAAPPARWRRRAGALVAWSGALPALAAAALAGGFIVAVFVRPDSATVEAYRREARSASQAGDHRAALIGLIRVSEAPDATPEDLWALAQAYEALGESARAKRLWDRLAPDDRPGYAPAHVRRAEALLKTASVGSESGIRAASEAEKHFRRALYLEPKSVPILTSLGRLLLATGRPGDAAPVFSRAADRAPELRMNAALAYAAAGRRELARGEAELASFDAARRVSDAPTDFVSRVRMAQAAVFLEDFPAATRVLREGLRRTGDPRYHRPLADVLGAHSDAEALRSPGDAAPSLLLLEEGLRIDPSNGPLLERFGRVLQLGGPVADQARQTLRETLARGEARAGAHFALGLDAWLRGDRVAARSHLEEAARLDPKAPNVANNLAWVLAHAPEPDLPRALALAALALERQPGNPRFRGTRGSVLTRLGRWKDALPDLETALTADPADPDLHRHLAEVYEHLGVPDMAAVHRGYGARPEHTVPSPHEGRDPGDGKG